MIDVDQALREQGLKSRMLLQVHDELLLEIAAGEGDGRATGARQKMGGAYPLDVALKFRSVTAAVGTPPRTETTGEYPRGGFVQRGAGRVGSAGTRVHMLRCTSKENIPVPAMKPVRSTPTTCPVPP